MPTLNLGPLLPDNPNFNNPGCVVADGCFPVAGGYAPFKGAGIAGGSAAEACRGAAYMERSDGTGIVVGGSDTRLWVDVSGTVTQTTGLTSIGSDFYWRFLRHQQYALAVAPNNDLQHLTAVDSDTSWSAVSDAPTRAEVIGEVGSRIIVGNLAGNPFGFEWSALNDPLTWTATNANYCGSANVDQKYGEITGIAGDRFPVMFQKYAVNRIDRVGPPSVFRVERIEEARGCVAPDSIVQVGPYVFFLAHDGFAMTNGAETRLIGNNRVTRWFLDDSSSDDLFRTHGVVDWAKQCVVWSYYPKAGSSFAKMIVYSWAQDNWSTVSMVVERLVSAKEAGVTLEGVDSYFASIEDVTPHLDSSYWAPGDWVLSAYREDGSNTTLYPLNGQNVEGTFEGGEFQPAEGKNVFINKVYPLIENTSLNTHAALLYKKQKGGSYTTSAEGMENAHGFCPVRGEGKYMAVRLRVPVNSDWDKASGYQVPDVKAGGKL